VFLVVLKVVGNVFAVQKTATLGFLDKQITNRVTRSSDMHNGAGGVPVDEFSKNLVATDQLEDAVVCTLSVDQRPDDLEFAHEHNLSVGGGVVACLLIITYKA